MSWTNESQGSTGGDTALLLVRTIEICSGRHGSAEQSLKNSAHYARLEQIASSMCSKLATKILAQVRALITHHHELQKLIKMLLEVFFFLKKHEL